MFCARRGADLTSHLVIGADDDKGACSGDLATTQQLDANSGELYVEVELWLSALATRPKQLAGSPPDPRDTNAPLLAGQRDQEPQP